MPKHRYRVGIVGLEPGRSWAANAHIPALRALADDFEIVGVANSSRASAEAAAKAMGLPRAFADVAELVASPEVDIVLVTVKVPHHLALASAAIEAGKHVYCEWPLGNGLQEARRLAELARQRGVQAVAGTQALFAPEIIHLRELLAEGYVGEVLSTTLVGTGMGWGPTIQSRNAYTLDRANGATMLSIPLGHTLAALTDALGPIAELSAVTAQRRHGALNADTGEAVAITAPDQILAAGVLESGAPISIHYRGGMAHGSGLIWEINGSEGDLRIGGPGGHAQMVQLRLSGGRGGDDQLRPIALPAHLAGDSGDGAVVGNVRRLYAAFAEDLRQGTTHAPRFDDALRVHRIIAAIEKSAHDRRPVRPDSL
jgi:predicted dehydrogenase